MKWIRTGIIFGVIILSMWSCASEHFQIEVEPSGVHVIKGVFERANLEHDSTFTWYKTNYQAYAIDPTATQELSARLNDIHFVLVLGTWCGDSKREVPQMFKIFDSAKIDDSDVLLLGVDRSKKSGDGLSERYKIERVPTLIVLKGDQELGRIVEQPRETLEKDLVRILQKQ